VPPCPSQLTRSATSGLRRRRPFWPLAATRRQGHGLALSARRTPERSGSMRHGSTPDLGLALHLEERATRAVAACEYWSASRRHGGRAVVTDSRRLGSRSGFPAFEERRRRRRCMAADESRSANRCIDIDDPEKSTSVSGARRQPLTLFRRSSRWARGSVTSRISSRASCRSSGQMRPAGRARRRFYSDRLSQADRRG